MRGYNCNLMKGSRLIILFIILVFLCLFYGCSQDRSDNSRAGSLSDGNLNYILVKRVVDGDTLVLSDGRRVRLIGIDTPELHVSDKLYRQAQRSKKDIQTIISMGKRAYKFTRRLVEGQEVRLEFDVEKYDRYNRLLCYVYLKDGTFVNAKIVQEGYASLLTIPPNVKYADLFRALYQEARRDKRGLWRE